MQPDHCTLWPDSWIGVNYSACCLGHDIAYIYGLPRAQADIDLAICVASRGAPIMAAVMLFGVAAFGWLFYKRKLNGS